MSAVRCLLEAAFIAENEYRFGELQEAYHEILGIYRRDATDGGTRRQIGEILRSWFSTEGNWYEILARLAASPRKPCVKITDFGISFRLPHDHPEIGPGKARLFGTPRYVAPEKIRGERGATASDIFSLGVVAYEMLVGEPPFPGLEKKSALKANLKRRIRIPVDTARSLSPDLVRLF